MAADHDQSILIPRVKLGNQGFEVSKLGFGCMGLSGRYNDPVPEDVGISIIKHAFDHGVTFFDTSDIYGANNANEILVGKALKHLPREKVQLATKFGIVKIDNSSGVVINGTPEYVRSCCEASLKCLDVEYIDLYYQHRIDTSVPIEDTMGELKKLVEEGKIKYIGLSEASPDTIRRANAVHPITAIQIEWSLWTRDIEEEIVPLCRELGIGIVPYSPLGRGFFGGRAVVEGIPADSFLASIPRFSGENFDNNKKIYWNVEKLAEKHECTPAQLALAWILHQGDDVVPIPGTTKIKNLDSNTGSIKVKLTNEDLQEISAVIPINEVAGERTTDIFVSKLGFGCMGLTGNYNDPVPEDVGISIIKHAFDHGVTFFDTSDFYGANNTNEILVGKALKQLPREKVQLATKFGIVKFDYSSCVVINGTPEYVRSCCEASLKRLDVEYIDLYYQHRIDTSVPIEDTMGELKKLVEEGKIKYIGLSEASPDTIRRANAVHPITAIQMEWSLWTRDVEEEIVPLCRELGIGIVPYSPLGRGFFGGRAVVESIPANSFLPSLPRFSGENFDKNKKLYWNVEKLAEKHECTPAQLALAWILHQGDDVVPIPGTTKIKNLDNNIGCIKVTLTNEDLQEISDAIPINEVAGERNSDTSFRCTWKFANTPPKHI
ncbi:hypothetical protein Dsin_024041 [Dipteronia sinensis]|uniref:NADP-dependent oxidoreductase domain-containing protein n=1 Tax=Dipteronia sinensis TaxID=43782 RepID=A0AAE0A5X4_9ROSI|nr:hypothetical protein Dsin_024041 [Dipteronia sinensis]